MKTILVTGSDGYCGWPIVLELLEKTEYKVIGVDNGSRRRFVHEVGGESILPIIPADTRAKELKKIYGDRFIFYNYNIDVYVGIYKLIKEYQPDTILHLASQPSAPFSSISGQHAIFTQKIILVCY